MARTDRIATWYGCGLGIALGFFLPFALEDGLVPQWVVHEVSSATYLAMAVIFIALFAGSYGLALIHVAVFHRKRT